MANGLNNENGSVNNARNQNSKQNELIDLFEVVGAEELLIEPTEMYQEDTSPFNPEKWLSKLEKNVQEEKVQFVKYNGLQVVSYYFFFLGGGGRGRRIVK